MKEMEKDFNGFIEKYPYLTEDELMELYKNNKFNLFEKKYHAYWDEAFDEFNNNVGVKSKLNHFTAYLWMTDCDTDDRFFAQWLYNNIGNLVEDTFICVDTCWDLSNYDLDEDEYTMACDIVSAVLGDAYDNYGSENAFWREDSLNNKDELSQYAELVKIADALITAYLKTIGKDKPKH